MSTSIPARELSPRSLVLDLLSVVRGHALPVRTLVRAAEVMGLSGNGLRVALSRLRGEGKVRLLRRGTYALSEAARRRNRRVLAWGEVMQSRTPWRGDWVGVQAAAPAADEKALRFLGFAALSPGLYVRPDNLRLGVAGVRGQLVELGLSRESLVFGLGELDAEGEARARGLWDGAALGRAHRATAAALRESARQINGRPVEDSLREMFVQGGEAIRQILLDPRLPDELASPAPLKALVEAMTRYDARGRRLWARYLGLDPDDLLPAAPADWAPLRDQLPTSALAQEAP